MKNDKNQETNDQHINTNGRSRLMSIGKVLPKDWSWVRVTRTRSDDNTVWLKIERMELKASE